MKTLTADELRERLENGPVALFDVRGDVVYEQGHIPGAKTAPLGSLVFRVARLMNPDSFVGVYGDGDGLGEEAAERLENLGLRNVYNLSGGIREWQAKGLPVVESVQAKVHTWGPVSDCRPVVVDRATAYGGAFGSSVDDEVAGAGG